MNDIILKNLLVVETLKEKDTGHLIVTTKPDIVGPQFSPSPPMHDVILKGIKVVSASFNTNGDLVVETTPS